MKMLSLVITMIVYFGILTLYSKDVISNIPEEPEIIAEVQTLEEPNKEVLEQIDWLEDEIKAVKILEQDAIQNYSALFAKEYSNERIKLENKLEKLRSQI